MPSFFRARIFFAGMLVLSVLPLGVWGCADEVASYHSHRMLGLAHQAERDQQEAARASEKVTADQAEIERSLTEIRADAAGASKDAGGSGRHTSAVVSPKLGKAKSKIIRHPQHPVEHPAP